MLLTVNHSKRRYNKGREKSEESKLQLNMAEGRSHGSKIHHVSVVVFLLVVYSDLDKTAG